MDPINLSIAALSFAGACVAQKCADATLEAAWSRIVAAYERWRGAPPEAGSVADLDPERGIPTSEFGTEVEQVFGLSSALRRARLVMAVLKGARVLWVDDHPENNTWERSLLSSLGVTVTTIETTPSAVAYASSEPFDVILSDIARDRQSDDGVAALPALHRASGRTPVVFYVGSLSSNQAPPIGAFGITNEPNELLHLVLDVLERTRT